MMKLLVVFFSIIIFLSSCGVSTSSSSSDTSSTDVNIDKNSDPIQELDLINSNPIGDAGNGNPDPTDPDPTDPDPTDPDPTDPDPGPDTTKEDSRFDTNAAIYDENACDPTFYKIARDASYLGVNTGENGAEFYGVEENSLGIASAHVEGSSANLAKTWVQLYYKAFPSIENLGLQGYSSYYMEGVFHLTYDIAWSDSSIIGIDNVIYVESQKTVNPSCYRVTIDNIIGTLIGVQKVYR